MISGSAPEQLPFPDLTFVLRLSELVLYLRCQVAQVFLGKFIEAC